MRIDERQLNRLAETLLQALLEAGGASLAAERGKVLARIEGVIKDNFTQEQDLDREARKLVDAHLAQAPPGIDPHKLFTMIKKKLAEERGIPL